MRVGEDSIERLVDASLPDVYHYLLRRAGSVQLAEDLTSETFLAAITALRSGSVSAITRGWLITVARNKLIDHWRRHALEERYLATASAELARDDGDAPFERGRAAAVLAQLGADHRTALLLRYQDGLSVAEVAGAMGRTYATTENLLARARTAFRDRYRRLGEADRA